VIISDHHQPDNSLPPANCFLHSTATSGAGVAWIFTLFLLGTPALKLLDLATIGVIGDMMLLQGLNRTIAVHGLQALSNSKRPGLLSMKKAMGIEHKDLTTYDISFGLAPRINAAGRIYNPLDALRLLCTNDQKLADDLARKIELHNQDRQEYTDRALKIATTQKVDHNIIVLLGDYHEGVIGLVAGKLTEMYSRPAIVMSDNGKVIKGSARSIPGVDITALLRSLKTPFLGLGGHPQAAGFSLAKSQVTAMVKEIETLADHLIASNDLVKKLSVDGILSLKQVTITLAKLISTLEPFGLGNFKPRFLAYDLTVLEDRPLGTGGKHRKLFVEQNGISQEIIWFNCTITHPITFIKKLVFTPEINIWRDRESLQLNAQYVET
ncbi:MAG: DHHA1 domain-containing protein, partial [bacterium]